MKLGDYAMETENDSFGTKTCVRILKIFKDGNCHVEDSATKARRDPNKRWRCSNLNKLTKIEI